MAYNKHYWLDEIVEFVSRYKLKDIVSGAVKDTVDLERVTGTITAQDKVKAIKLNNIEDSLERVYNDFYQIVDGFYVFSYSGANMVKVEEFSDLARTKLKTEVTMLYTGSTFTGSIEKQYDKDGFLLDTITTTLTFTNGKLTGVERVVS